MQTEQSVESIVNDTLDQSRVGEIGKRLASEIRSLEPAEIVDSTRRWTRENPLMALGVALGTGLLLGLAIRSASRIEVSQEPESSRHRFTTAMRQSGNDLAHKARQASENVVSEITSKLSTVETPSLGSVAKESVSFADTLIAGLTASVSRKLSDWLKKR